MSRLLRKIVKYFVLSLIVGLAACDNSHEGKAPLLGLKYYPLRVGNNWIYKVNEVRFDTLIQNIKLSYQEKFEVVDSFVNLSNEMTYVIYLSTRPGSSSDWKYAETWTARVSKLNELLVAKENVTYVEMLLPVSNGLTWRGNKYNTIESTRNNNRVDNFVISDLQVPYDSFPKAFNVTESDEDNFAYQDLRYSIYAENTGLVYRVNRYIEFCNEEDCFGLNERTHEVTKEEILVEYEAH